MSKSFETRLSHFEAMQPAGQDAPPAPVAKVIEPPPLRRFVESLQIEDKVSGGLIPFKLWPAQVKALKAMQEHDRLFWLKARQCGATWTSCAFWLYEANFWGNRLILLARQSAEDAADAIHRLKILHASMPEEWRQPILADNVMTLGLANGSRFQALTATRRIGRGRAAYGGIADEAAWWPDTSIQLAALDAACERLHLLTTAAGPGDAVHKIWQQAQAGKGRWHPLFSAWDAHPRRGKRWYRLNVAEAPDPRLARREFPSSPEQAFEDAGAGRFFERFSAARNVARVSVVPSWRTYRCADFGYRFCAAAWCQVSPTGQLFIISELPLTSHTTQEFAQAILKRDAELGVTPAATYVDPAGQAVAVQTSRSEVSIFRDMGLRPQSKSSGIRDGCVVLMDLLADPEIPLMVSTACPWLIEAFSTIRPDRLHADVYDESSDFDHILDACRYLVVNMRRAGTSSGVNRISHNMYGTRPTGF